MSRDIQIELAAPVDEVQTTVDAFCLGGGYLSADQLGALSLDLDHDGERTTVMVSGGFSGTEQDWEFVLFELVPFLHANFGVQLWDEGVSVDPGPRGATVSVDEWFGDEEITGPEPAPVSALGYDLRDWAHRIAQRELTALSWLKSWSARFRLSDHELESTYENTQKGQRIAIRRALINAMKECTEQAEIDSLLAATEPFGNASKDLLALAKTLDPELLAARTISALYDSSEPYQPLPTDRLSCDTDAPPKLAALVAAMNDDNTLGNLLVDGLRFEPRSDLDVPEKLAATVAKSTQGYHVDPEQFRVIAQSPDAQTLFLMQAFIGKKKVWAVGANYARCFGDLEHYLDQILDVSDITLGLNTPQLRRAFQRLRKRVKNAR